MPKQIRDVMTDAPLAVGPATTVTEAARAMRDRDVGAVLVMEGEQLRGLVTDRDLVVRVVADGGDIATTPVLDACSEEVITVGPDDPEGRAVDLMRGNALRRLPVVENNRPVGIVSLGDLAVDRDPGSALGEISASQPNI